MKTQKQCLSKYMLYKCIGQCKKARQYKRTLDMFKNNNICASDTAIKNINIDIVGSGNTVVIKDGACIHGNIAIFGNNNSVYIDKNVKSSGNINILLGQNHHNFGPIHDSSVHIGHSCTFESAEMIIKNSNAKIIIGNRCMFAFNITLYHTDSHPIFDIKTNAIINKVKTLSIGDHVWIGANVVLLKNTTIADDCIIGWGSIVSGKFDKPHGRYRW